MFLSWKNKKHKAEAAKKKNHPQSFTEFKFSEEWEDCHWKWWIHNNPNPHPAHWILLHNAKQNAIFTHRVCEQNTKNPNTLKIVSGENILNTYSFLLNAFKQMLFNQTIWHDIVCLISAHKTDNAKAVGAFTSHWNIPLVGQKSDSDKSCCLYLDAFTKPWTYATMGEIICWLIYQH